MSFWKDATANLDQPLDKGLVKQRRQGGRQVDYIEGWSAIETANRIFGYGGWSYTVAELKQITKETVEKDGKSGWNIGYRAIVRVEIGGTLVGEVMPPSVCEDVGYGNSVSYQSEYDCHEGAGKEAVTDALKRALKKWGWQFGLALYDKTKEHVTDVAESASTPPRSQQASTSMATGEITYGIWLEALKAAKHADVVIKTQKHGDVPLWELFTIDKGYVTHWIATNKNKNGFTYDKSTEFLASLPPGVQDWSGDEGQQLPEPCEPGQVNHLAKLMKMLGKDDDLIEAACQAAEKNGREWTQKQIDRAAKALDDQQYKEINIDTLDDGLVDGDDIEL